MNDFLKFFGFGKPKIVVKNLFSITKKPLPILSIRQISNNGVTRIEVDDLQSVTAM